MMDQGSSTTPGTPRAPGGTRASVVPLDDHSIAAAIAHSSQDAIIVKTLDGLVTFWNDAATEQYGRTAEEMLGRSIEATFPPGAIGDERSRRRAVGEGEAFSGYRCTRVHADGRVFECVMTLSPLRDETGAVTSVVSVSRPVTAEERQSERFASLLEAAPDGILCVGPEGTITALNARVPEIFGYDVGELLGAPLEVLIPEDRRAVHVAHRDGFFTHPQVRSMGAGLALSGRRRDGTVFPVEVSLAPDHSTDPVQVIAAVRDVTASASSRPRSGRASRGCASSPRASTRSSSSCRSTPARTST